MPRIDHLLPVLLLFVGHEVKGSESRAAAPHSRQGRVVSLEDFETARDWFTWAGDRDPRPTGGMTLTTVAPYRGKHCGSFFFDTSCDQGYISSDLRCLFPPAVSALRFRVRSPGRVKLVLRLVDRLGQTHQVSLPQQPGPWRQVSIALTKPFPLHFGGPNDGRFHQPFTRLQFLRESGSEPKVGTIFIDDVEVVTTAPAAQLFEWYWRKRILHAETDAPGNLFFPTDAATMSVTADTPPAESEVVVGGEVKNAWNKRIGTLPPVYLNADNRYHASFRLPNALGYYQVTLTVADGPHRQTCDTRYAVIPVNSAVNRSPDSPFGVNTHFNQGWPPALGALIRRTGITWIRDGEASLNDKALPVAQANHLSYLPCFTKWRAPLAQRFKETLARNPQAPRRWDFSAAVAWHRKYAAKYGDSIDAYDLMNEPHGPWSEALGGGWQGGPWLTTFAEYGRQVSAALHTADPAAKVVWEDIDQLLWYREFARLPGADSIDVISPHAYNLHPTRPYPEQQPILEQLGDFASLVRTHQLPWEVWVGEVGFSSFQRTDQTHTGFYAPCTETEQAELLVRMMVLQLAHGVKRIFWYDFMNDGWDPHNPEHNFGLIRNDRLPKPAVVAYANLIHRLHDSASLRAYAVGGDAFAYACVPPAAGGEPWLVAWVMTGGTNVSLPAPSGVKTVTVTDLYGRVSRLPVNSERLVVDLSTSPVYIDGLRREDVAPCLTGS